MNITESLRDVSRREAARITGHSQRYLARHWDEIPTAIHEGRNFWVSLDGLRRWQDERGISQDTVRAFAVRRPETEIEEGTRWLLSCSR